LLKAKAATLEIQYVGKAIAKAKAKAEEERIKGQSWVESAKLSA